MRCEVCFRHCDIREGGTGFCGAREVRGGNVVAANYGRITSLALDPIEKKPLRNFNPGTKILSAGSYGCNLRCPFCQNNEISWGEEVMLFAHGEGRELAPEELVSIAEEYKERGNIGIAFTYNEPLVGYEFVRDTARLAHGKGLKTVVVTNGTAELSVLREIAPYIDAMNIDLKCFDPDVYKYTLGGDLDMTMAFIREAVKTAHVEITCLIVPGMNDDVKKMKDMAGWIASISEDIPLHVTRFHPCFHMTDRPATPADTICELADAAAKILRYVYFPS